jgi:hypothetical protein
VGRPTVLTPQVEEQLDRLLAAGVTQTVAAQALGIGSRSVSRFVARRRVELEPKSFDELLSDLAEVVAGEEPPRRFVPRPRRTPKPDWETAAAMLAGPRPDEDEDWLG